MERKVATVLFADLVGSTQLGEQDPERTRALLDRFFTAMREEVERVGGEVEKYAGDAVMAAFGAPHALEDHAERALHAALAMQRRLADVSGELRLRIGVNTGEVVVGGLEAFVTGDAVNVCARLEQNADPGTILVGERTVHAARGAFEFGEPVGVQAKGKRDPIPARRLLRATAEARPRGRFPRPFVGRGDDLAALAAAFSRAVSESAPVLVLVLGDAGVGKSRLVREFLGVVDASAPAARVHVGRCLSYGSGITYWPIREILQGLLDLPERFEADEAERVFGARGVLALAFGHDVGASLHPLAARDRFRDAWAELLGEAAAAGPVVLVVEDVHWAENPLLELLERTVREVRGPLLVVATARPDVGWTGGRHATALELEPLSDQTTTELLQDLPADVRDLLVQRAEGNPFFAEELVESLVDRGILVRGDGVWSSSVVPARLEMPDSVRGVLAARVDLLPPREKAALQAASVIGRVFWEGPVRELIADDADFALLEERDFIRRRPDSRLEGEREHTIKHALTRQAAYDGIPRARRARLHAAFADWIEQRRPDDDLASLLAHHYAEAVRPEDAELAWANDAAELERVQDKALTWLRRAADRAMGRYELEDALALLERALPLAGTRRERTGVLRSIGRVHALNFAGEPFWGAMQAAIDEADDDALRSELYAEIAFESVLRSGIWQQMPARDTVDDWVDRALEHAPPDSRARAMALIARARWAPENGGQAAVEASQIAERLDDAALRSAAWDARGIIAFVAGEFDLGRAWAERRFELLEDISDPDVRADIHSAPISGCVWSGRFEEARRLARAHDDIVRELTPHHRLHGVAIEIEVEELLGRWDLVRGLQPRAEVAITENLETPCIRNPRSLLVCALSHEHGGDPHAARRLEERALEMWQEGYGATLDTPLLRLALARGELDEAERLLGLPDTRHGWHRGWFVFANVAARLDAFAELGRRDDVEREAEPHLRRRAYLRPFAYRALGRVRRDRALLGAALREFEELGLDWEARLTRGL